MKRTLKITGIISCSLTIIGAVLKFLHLPGAGVAILLGLAFFSLVFVPLNIVMKFRNDREKNNRLIKMLGLLCASVAAIGVLFKIKHWPGANVIIVVYLSVFTFIFIPIFFITNFKNPETKFNAIIHTVFMITAVGMFFALINLGYSTIENKQKQGIETSQISPLKPD